MEFPATPSPAERAANSQEDPVALTFARLRCPAIRRQIARLHLAAEESLRGSPILRMPEPETPGGQQMLVESRYEPMALDEVERELDARIADAAAADLRGEGDEQPSSEKVPVGWVNPMTGRPLDDRQLAIVEAHEKGHRVRYSDRDGVFLRAYFGSGFDPEAIVYTDKDFEIERARAAESGEPAPTRDEARAGMADYLFSGQEVAERMSQLKSYFGFAADEEFTAEHLRVARERYVADTGLDNRMTFFLQAITPEREARFLRLINSSGI
jgi:hypothetical protein